MVAILSSLELKTVLSLIETSNAETDVKQRAWMLRSLIAHVNTDSEINTYYLFDFPLPLQYWFLYDNFKPSIVEGRI